MSVFPFFSRSLLTARPGRGFGVVVVDVMVVAAAEGFLRLTRPVAGGRRSRGVVATSIENGASRTPDMGTPLNIT